MGDLIYMVMIFVLSMFVGIELIKKIPPTLHTPLMSGSNAISGIVLVGAIISSDFGRSTAFTLLSFIALIASTINVVGGFLVTHRMLKMLGRKNDLRHS
uniref:proton-translocating NAD(P)(+) transhydrogenase n=1 Tax=uncultured prokaryote TaxID=198431 RepID=H5SQ00_9ZZZZ|nr:NAD(P) transhydrogenase subunit alpha [uncultured prokaryote]